MTAKIINSIQMAERIRKWNTVRAARLVVGLV